MMQLFTLLPTTYQPGPSLKAFDSLAWTERYRDAGDFQLVVMNDVSVLTLLPLGAFISHTDTKEVMIVENHEINRGKDKQLKITVTGRSFETFSENRVTEGSKLSINNASTGEPNIQVTSALPSSEVAVNLMQKAMQVSIAPNENDVLPGVRFYKTMRSLDIDRVHVVKRGSVYSSVLEFLAFTDSGIKTVRPTPDVTTLDVVVHDGLDLRNIVVFHAQRDDLDDATYFWSIQDYKSYVQIATNNSARNHRHRVFPDPLWDFARRAKYLEATDITGSYDEPSDTGALANRAQSELEFHKKISLVQAKISQTAKPKFKIDYNIGDLVTVFGDFIAAQAMRVTEHILTVDKTGSRGYPSLSVV